MDAELILVRPSDSKHLKLLMHNIKVSLKDSTTEFDYIDRKGNFVLVYTDEIEDVIEMLKNVFGISALFPAIEVGAKKEAIERTIQDLKRKRKSEVWKYIIGNKAFISTQNFSGLKGMPVGSSGKAVVVMENPEQKDLILKALSMGFEVVVFHPRKDDRESQQVLNICKACEKFSSRHNIKFVSEKISEGKSILEAGKKLTKEKGAKAIFFRDNVLEV